MSGGGFISYMNSIIGDICDYESLNKQMRNAEPDIVVHMAAQPLVRYSYLNPIETFSTNVMGTAYMLEAVGKAKKYGKPVYLDVGKESTAYMMEDALMQMAMNGETAAWRVEVRLHTLQ